MDITITGLSKVYHNGVYALDNLDLAIPGGMFGLLGPNGAGKTTLMRVLAGILQPTGGTLRAGDHDLRTEHGRQALKRVLGYLPQELGVYPDLSAREFLDYVAILKGVDNRKVRQQCVTALLEVVGLQEVAKRKLKTFSGGMKRRVGIAQALLNDPQLLIVDEPTAGLDPEERIRFRNLLAELGGSRTVLLSTHIVEDIAQTCQNLALLKDGRVIFHGTTAAILREAQDRVWTITTSGCKPEGNFTIVSTMRLESATQYRVVGRLSPRAGAIPVQPTLEDGYVWLMSRSAWLASLVAP